MERIIIIEARKNNDCLFMEFPGYFYFKKYYQWAMNRRKNPVEFIDVLRDEEISELERVGEEIVQMPKAIKFK